MGIALLAKKLFWPERALGSEYVTKAQLDERVGRIEKENETRFDKIEKDIDSVQKKVDSVHDGQESLKIEFVRGMERLTVTVEHLAKAPPPRSPDVPSHH